MIDQTLKNAEITTDIVIFVVLALLALTMTHCHILTTIFSAGEYYITRPKNSFYRRQA